MSLVHDFAIISKEYDELEILRDMKKVSIPDDIILYMSDSLKWINSYWNGKEYKESLNYYGYSFISGEDLNKLAHIVNIWKELFSLAPDTFFITSEYILNEKRYEKISIKRKEIVSLLSEWRNLCKEAIEDDCNIIHRGI